jgi:hypothetical protein
MDIDTPPNSEISLQTVLDAVNCQGQKIEAKVGVKISEKICLGVTLFFDLFLRIALFSVLMILDSSSESLTIGFVSY